MVAIALYAPTSIWGRIISRYSKSPYAHVGIFHRMLEKQFITQALDLKGVCCHRLGPHTTAKTVIPLPWIPDEIASAWLSERWGVNYGWWDLLLFPFKRFRPLMANRKGLICSELAILFLQGMIQRCKDPWDWTASDHRIMAIEDPSRVSPGDVFALLTATYPVDSQSKAA